MILARKNEHYANGDQPLVKCGKSRKIGGNMTQYLYPQNLKATANLWLWSLRDFAILGVAALISIVLLVELQIMLPAAVTLCYAFLILISD